MIFTVRDHWHSSVNQLSSKESDGGFSAWVLNPDASALSPAALEEENWDIVDLMAP